VPSPPLYPTLEWGDHELTLHWEPPEDDGGTPVLSYSVQRRAEGEDWFTLLVSMSADGLRCVDDATVNGIEYTYRVTAWNLVGEGSPSEEVSSVPAGAPGAPTEVAGHGLNASAVVSWLPPTWDGGRMVTGYRVYAIAEGTSPSLLAELGPDTLQFEATGLLNGGLYLYGVRAVTEAGESVLSDIAEARPFGPPGEPKGLAAFWVDGAVQLTWTSPADDGGSPVTAYLLRRGDVEGGNWTEVLVLMFSDPDVEPGGTYEYTLVAINAAGRGPATSVSITIPQLEEPDTEERTVGPWPYLLMLLIATAIIIALVHTKRQGGADKDPTQGSE